MRMKLSFLLNVWYDLSLDLSFDPLNPKLCMAQELSIITITMSFLPGYVGSPMFILDEEVSFGHLLA